MTPGHFGLAAGAKQVAPRLPLWALFLATYLLDVIFVFLLAAGIEGLTPIEPAHPNAYGGVLVHAYYTHSLVGALLLSAIAGWLANRRWGKREGQVVAALVFSHWRFWTCSFIAQICLSCQAILAISLFSVLDFGNIQPS